MAISSASAPKNGSVGTTYLIFSVVAVFLFSLGASTGFAEELRLAVLDKPTDGIKKAYVSYSLASQKPSGVLVLVDVYNRPERPVAEGAAKTAFNQMVDEVAANQLAFVRIEINEDGSLASRMDKKKGAVGNLVMRQVRDLFGTDVPLCLYPANKGAVPIVSEILSQFPEQIGSWCFFNALPEGSWNKNITVPGIIACQNNLAGRTELEAAFKEGRDQGKSWTWLEFAPNNTKGFQSFLWKYFAESVKKPEGTWFAIPSETKIASAQVDPRSADFAWLPSETTGTTWAALHEKMAAVIAEAPLKTEQPAIPAPDPRFPEVTLEAPCAGAKAMYFTYSQPKEEAVGVVLLLNIYNRKQKVVRNAEAQALFAQMVQEINGKKLAFVQVDINEDGKLLASMQSKDYRPKKGVSNLIMQQLRQLFGNQIQVCLYPKSRSMFHILSEMEQEFPKEIAAWGTYNLLPLEDFGSRFSGPGLIACGNDHVELEKFEKYFKDGRSKGRKLTWLEVKPSAEKEFQSFVWNYFASACQKTEDSWFALSTMKEVEKDALDLKSADLVYNPSLETGKSWAGLQNKRTAIPTVIEKIIDPKVEGLSPLSFYLRLPPGAKDGRELSGIIAYCTWVGDRKSLMQQLLYDTDRPEKQLRMPAVQMLKYASQHNLGVLTWSTPGKWSAGRNSDELERKELKKIDAMFDDYAAMWEKGVAEFVKETGIPESDYLLYGMSRGAQWAHRLALRKPERFWAINIHVNSSYDLPTPAGSECLWLVTTGDMEHGYAGGKRFYSQSLALGYPMIFKAEEKLGHNSCKEVETLRDLFFDFALGALKERGEKGLPKKEMAQLMAQRLKQSPFIGDYLNQDVFAANDAEFVSPSLRVYLPNEELAKAWKAKYTPDTVK